MTVNPFPTRAEATDIHSAVMDGTDCLCLNQETNYGKYPLESLENMNNICLAAEQQFDYQEFFHEMIAQAEQPMKTHEAVANSAIKSAFNL